MKNTNFYILILFLFLSLSGNAQEIKHLGVKDGLKSGTVRAFEKDSLGYLWIGTSQGLNRYSGFEFKTYALEKYSKSLGNQVVEIFNHQGDLFVLGGEGKLLKYRYERDDFVEILNLKDHRFISLAVLDASKLMIGLQHGLLIFDLEENSESQRFFTELAYNRHIEVIENQVFVATSKGIEVFEYLGESNDLKKKQTFLKGKEVLHFAFDKQQRIWAGTFQEGLFVLKNGKVQKIQLSENSGKLFTIRALNFDKNNQALVSVEGAGLWKINENFEITKKFKHNLNNINSISQNSIYEIFVDENNVYWLGHREVGIDLIYPESNPFQNIYHIPYKPNSINSNSIRAIFEGKNGNIWFGTEKGISQLNADGNWTNYTPILENKNIPILAINQFQNQLILGSYGKGLLDFNPQNSVTQNSSFITHHSSLDKVYTIFSKNEDLWIAGIGGPVQHYNSGNLVKNYSTGNTRIITEGREGKIYIGSVNGLFEIDKDSQTQRRITSKEIARFDKIFALLFDTENNCLWVGNQTGLFQYDLQTEAIKLMNHSENFETGTVFSIQKDEKGNLWLGTIMGLWEYHISTKTYRKYEAEEGVEIQEFGFGATTKFKDGTLAFGGPKGAVIFNPNNLKKEATTSKIFISNFEINGVEADTTLIPKNINFLDKIELAHNQNSLSFDFEILKFHGSRKANFIWQLKGYDSQPIVSKNNRKASYSKLESGNYLLEVKTTNPDGKSSADTYQLAIEIKKPFWKTGWAFLIYTILLAGAIYLIYWASRAREKAKFSQEKIQFFIDVAHDIRTPVSLIQLLVNQLGDKKNRDNSIALIQRNTQNLNEYVTQLLDFQKADKGQLKLFVKEVNLKDFMKAIIADFQPLLEEKSIDIFVSIPPINIWFDAKKMTRIFYNLISNAIKYSHEGGQINIKADTELENIKIDFIDNGVGIPEKQQKTIFSRFSRGTNVSNQGIAGTGLGLMLSKKIVELHGGQVLLESKENIGSKFTVILKKGTQHYKDHELIIESSKSETANPVDSILNKEKLILLVDDSSELRQTVKAELEQDFKVLDAPNGKEGLLIALAKNPDLIITDVKMPEMNGKELCQIIKSNFKTSHIPVIMISALNDADDKIEGIQTGADAYVEKPFNLGVLKATINNLLKSRQLIQERAGVLTKSPTNTDSPDETFLSKVVQIIHENFENEDFSIDFLCQEMGLSRSNLFRKLKGLTGMSPSALILKIKLNHAAELLKTKKGLRVVDVAYKSGFPDQRYFSTVFKKHFGKTPKEFGEG